MIPAMSEPTTPPAAPAPTDRQPTMEDMLAIQKAAPDAAEKASSAAEAVSAGLEAMKGEAANRGLTIPDELIGQISQATAGATIEELRRVGALVEDGATPPAAPPASGEPPAPGNPSAPPADPPADPPAGKRNFAQRFLGL